MIAQGECARRAPLATTGPVMPRPGVRSHSTLTSLRHYVRARGLKAAGMDWTEVLGKLARKPRASTALLAEYLVRLFPTGSHS
jgi:hypothetical protein